MFESILHGRWHPDIAEMSASERLGFMNQIYTPHSEALLEAKRKQVLWGSLVGACQYAAAYEANSGSKNREQLDDIEFYVPNSIRVSIHRKPESVGQFSVAVGKSLHRTPWHGTAAFYRSSRGDTISLGTRLSFQLKNQDYLPVFVLAGSSSDPTKASPLSRVDWKNQPFFWVENEIIKREKGKDEVLSDLVNRIIQTKLKYH